MLAFKHMNRPSFLIQYEKVHLPWLIFDHQVILTRSNQSLHPTIMKQLLPVE